MGPSLGSAASDLVSMAPALEVQGTVVVFIELARQLDSARVAVTWVEVAYGFDLTYPIRVTQLDESVNVEEATEDQVDLLGRHLKQIGGLSVQVPIKLLREAWFEPPDLYLTNPGVLYGLHVLPPISQGTFTFEDASGRLLPVDLEPVRADEVDKVSVSRTPFPARCHELRIIGSPITSRIGRSMFGAIAASLWRDWLLRILSLICSRLRNPCGGAIGS